MSSSNRSLQNIRGRLLCAWLAVAVVGYAANVSATEWYQNCFTPNLATLLNEEFFPEIAALDAIGSGFIERVSATASSDQPLSLQVSVMAHRQSFASRDAIFLLDTESGCLSKLHLSKPIPERKGLAFNLQQQADNNCRTRSKLSKASIVEIYKCRKSKCREKDHHIFLFLGPVEYDGMTVSDHPLYGGEFNIRELSERLVRQR